MSWSSKDLWRGKGRRENVNDVWGWESPEERLKRYAKVSPERKMQALEEMRRFLLKARPLNRRTGVRKTGGQRKHV